MMSWRKLYIPSLDETGGMEEETHARAPIYSRNISNIWYSSNNNY